MKKILIVSSLFFPNNSIGAVRYSKFATHLINRGYKVYLVTGQDEEGIYKNKQYINMKVFSIYVHDSFKTPNVQVKNKRIHLLYLFKNLLKRNPFIRYIYANILFLRDLSSQRRILKKGKSTLLTVVETIRNERIDKVIITYGPILNLLIMTYIKKKLPGVSIILDLRDGILTSLNNKFQSIYLKRLENKSVRLCNELVTVSEGLKMKYSLLTDKRISVIYNGYDSNDLVNALDLEIKSYIGYQNKLCFSYFGSTYLGKRKLAPLFKSLERLSKKEKIDISKVEIVYAGDDYSYLHSEAEKFKMSNYITNLGRIDRSLSIKIQSLCDVSVVLTWNYHTEQGVLTGKFFEAMGLGTQILGIVEGDLINSEIRTIINRYDLGFCYEECDIFSDVELDKFIERLYVDKIFNMKRQAKIPPKNFEYSILTDQLIEILENSKMEQK